MLTDVQTPFLGTSLVPLEQVIGGAEGCGWNIVVERTAERGMSARHLHSTRQVRRRHASRSKRTDPGVHQGLFLDTDFVAFTRKTIHTSDIIDRRRAFFRRAQVFVPSVRMTDPADHRGCINHVQVLPSFQQPTFQKKTQNIKDLSAAHVVIRVVSSGVMNCRLLKW